MWHSQKEAQKLAKLQKTDTGVSKESNAVFTRFLERRAEERRAELAQRREEAQKLREKKQEEKAEMDKKKLKNEKLKLRNSKLRMKIKRKTQKDARKAEKADAAKKYFTPKECGETHATGGTAVHLKNRVLLLEKLKEAAPPLPPGLAAAWPFYRNGYAQAIGQKWKAGVGARLCKEVAVVLLALGRHPNLVLHPAKKKKKAIDIDERAFEKYAKAMYDNTKKCATAIMFE